MKGAVTRGGPAAGATSFAPEVLDLPSSAWAGGAVSQSSAADLVGAAWMPASALTVTSVRWPVRLLGGDTTEPWSIYVYTGLTWTAGDITAGTLAATLATTVTSGGVQTVACSIALAAREPVLLVGQNTGTPGWCRCTLAQMDWGGMPPALDAPYTTGRACPIGGPWWYLGTFLNAGNFPASSLTPQAGTAEVSCIQPVSALG